MGLFDEIDERVLNQQPSNTADAVSTTGLFDEIDERVETQQQAQQPASFAGRAAGAVNSINNTVNNLRPLAGRVVYNAAKAIENIANPDSSIKSGLSNAAKAVNDFKNKYIHDPAVEYGRNAARAYLPEGMENKFIGSKGDEEFLQTYSDNNVPSYKQIKELMQSNAITKQQALEQTALRAKLDRLTAEKEYTDERNKNLGLGALVLGSSLIPGVNIAGKALPAAASSTAVKTTPKALSLMKSGALNGAIGGGAYGLGESFIDDKVNPISSVPQSAALASAFGSVLSPALGFGIAAAPYAGKAAKNAVKETVSRLNPKNYERILKYGKPRRRGTGLSGREVYEPEYKWMYKPNERLYNARRAAESYQYPADDNVISAQFNAGEARQRKPAEGESVSDKIAELAPNIAEKQKNNAKIINDLYNSENIESEPEKYTGKRSVKDVLTYLGSTDGKTAVVKTPIEDVIFDKSNIRHLVYDNNPERLQDVNKVKRTLENPNLVIQAERGGKTYNYYVKSYKGNDKVSAHLQVVKKCDDGSFYTTNYPARNNKITDLLKNGRTVYSSSSFDSTYTDNGVPVNNSITDNKVNFKGDETKTNLEQLAPKTAAKLGLVIPENTPVVQREIQSDVNLNEDKKHYSKFYDERQQNIRNAKEAGKDIKGMQADARQVLYTAIEKTYPNYSKAAINRAISIVTSDKKYKTPAMRRYAEKLYDAITDKLDDKIEALSGVEGTFPELSYDNRAGADYEKVIEDAIQILKGGYSPKDQYGMYKYPKDIYEYAENQRAELDFILSQKGSDITTDELLDEKNNINSFVDLIDYLENRGPSDPDNAENEKYWHDWIKFAEENWKYISDTREELQNALKDIRIEEEKAEIRKNARADRRRNKSKNQGVERLVPGPGQSKNNLRNTTANEINAQDTRRSNYEAQRNRRGVRQGADYGAEAARVSQKPQSSNLEQITSQKPAATKQDLVNKYYEQCKNTDMTDEQAASAGELISEMISATADGMGISIAQADKRFGMIIKSMTAGQAKAQWAKDNNIYFQTADSAGAETSAEISAAKKEWKEKGVESKYFKKWSKDTPVVKSEEAVNYDFKTGQGVTVESFHGTKRADRVGSVFRADRATSGPMAFFSSSRNVSESYAKNKEDTSLANEINGYEDWFKIKVNGKEIKINKVWYSLTPEQRKTISERAPHIRFDDDYENIIYDENETRGVGNYDYEIKRQRGNAINTLLEGWLNGGSLFNREGDFVEVLKMAGLDEKDIVFNDPNADYSAVYETYITMQNPFVTSDIPQKVITKLEKQAKKQPVPENMYGADIWDKNTRNTVEWIEELKKDITNGENSYVWTSIPDWVTDVLKSFGYDGIIDTGGKSGGQIHQVYIPFYSTQIKSVNNQGTFDESNPNIYYQSANNMSNNFDNVVDLSNEFDKTPTLDEVKAYINEVIEQGTKFATLSPDWFVDIKGGSKKKDHIIKSSHFATMSKSQKNRHRKYIMSLEKLLANAEYAGVKENTKPDQKPNVAKYHYFKTNVKIGDKTYQILFDTEEYVNENSAPSANVLRSVKNLEADTNSITDNKENVKQPQTVHLYDITELKNKKNGHLSSVDNNIDNAKGFTYERTNDTGESENFIGLLQGKADMSTIVHEAGHVWLTVLNKAAEEGSQAAQKMTARINKWLGSDDGNYTDEQHEKFAESFVEYIRTNKAPNSGLREVFRKFKKWLNDIYQNIKTKIKLSAEAKEVFDELFGKRKPAEGSTGNDTSGMSRIEQLAPKTAAKIRFQKEEKGIGLSRLRRTEESGDEQQSGSREKDIDKASKIKQSDNTAQKTAKQAIREWKAGVETDRYDVDKALNSFIIHTKQTAKDLSKTTGMKVNDKLVREIMPFLRERTGVPEKLGRKDLTKLYNRLSKSDKARLTAFADEVSNKFQKYYENYNNVRGVVPESVIENHISHIWDLDKKQTGLLTSYFSTKSRFGKERTIETLMKGINGIETETGEIISLKPKTLDYAEILKISSDSLIKAAHDSLLAQRVKNLTHNGEKLVKRLDKAPADWVKIEHPALSKALYRGETSEGEKIWENLPAAVHPDIADTLLTVFEIQKPDNAGLKGYDTLSAFMKQAQLGFSGFHGFALSEAAIGNMGLGRTLKVLNPMRIIKEISSGNYSVYKEDSIAKHAIEHGLQLGTPTDLDRNMVEKLVTSAESSLSKVSYIGKAAELLGKGWDNTAGKILGGGIKLNNKVLWNYLHNNFKLETYKFLIERQTKANKGKLSEDDFNEIAQWVNDSFGGQAWELLGVKPSAQKWAKRGMLSPDWFVSTLRQFMGMFATETGSRAVSKAAKTKAFWKKVQKGSEALGIDSITDNINSSGMRGKIARAFWIRSLIYMTIGYNLLNATMREKDRKENPEYYPDKMTPKDYSLWGNYKPSDKLTDKALPRVFIGRNSEGKELYMRWGKQFREVPELITSPREHLGNKAAPLLQLGSKLAYGHSLGGFEDKNFFEKKGGQKVMKQGAELAKARAGAIGNAMLPISVQNTKDRSKSTPWALFQPVSKGMSFYTARESFEKIYEKGGKAEDIERTKDLAYRAGMDKKSIESARKQAYNDFTAPYKEAFINALEKDNSSKIEQIGKEMDKKHIAPAEQQKIYMKALKEYYKSKGISF